MTCTTTIFDRYDSQCREFEGHYNYYLAHKDDWNWNLKRDFDTQKYKEMGGVARFHEKVANFINNNEENGQKLLDYLKSKPNYDSLDSQPLIGFSDSYILTNEANDKAFNELKNVSLTWWQEQQSESPTLSPSKFPSSNPTNQPTNHHSLRPTDQPTVFVATQSPTLLSNNNSLPPTPNSSLVPANQENNNDVNQALIGTTITATGLLALVGGAMLWKRCKKDNNNNEGRISREDSPPPYINDDAGDLRPPSYNSGR